MPLNLSSIFVSVFIGPLCLAFAMAPAPSVAASRAAVGGIAASSFKGVFSPPAPARAPATRYAVLSPAQCRKQLAQRNIAHTRVASGAPGIATPLRLTAPLHGVRFVAPGRTSKFGLLDCRLALALDDLAKLLAKHDVAEVAIDNFYRPNARLPSRRKASQHAYGLAADITGFKLADGRMLNVERDFLGVRGATVCGPGAGLVTPTAAAQALRNIVCVVAEAGLFHDILTPNYNAAHRDHLHLDIARDANRISVK